MQNRFLFKYTIGSAGINVYNSTKVESSNNMNKELYNGLMAAIAEYLYYPTEVISPRLGQFHIQFACDESKLMERSDISEITKHAFLNYIETHPEEIKHIIPEYAITADLSNDKLIKWVRDIRKEASNSNIIAETVKSESEYQWLKFSYDKGMFYGRYRKCDNSKYLLVSLPCYNSDWNDISYLYDKNWDILQLAPLGYNTPYGFNNEKRFESTWPVLYDTVKEIDENAGYKKWFAEATSAIYAIRKPNQELIFIGTSQGGGASLVMASIFNNITVACAAEMPFLIGFSDKNYIKVRDFVADKTGAMIYDFYAKEKLFVIDPLRHTDRIQCPTFLLSGELDEQCPKEDILDLYSNLKCEKEYIDIKGAVHGYTDEFKFLAREWLYDMID